jgi:formamidopyrimidine-DNA glycosylase
MPELPEVEVVRLFLESKLIGKKISKLEIITPKSFIGNPEAVVGQKIISTSRLGKQLSLHLQNKLIILFHLKMTGQIIYQEERKERGKYLRAIIELNDHSRICFQDVRRFGWIKLVKQDQISNSLLKEKLGPEPISKDFTLEYLTKITQKARKPIKNLLLEQNKIAGIGNIYANEALFLAKIDPRRLANSLTKREIIGLKASIIEVIHNGIKHGGASDNDYLSAYGKKGSYQDHFLVYKKQGQKCRSCGEIIKRIKIAGRGTFFCPNCQK